MRVGDDDELFDVGYEGNVWVGVDGHDDELFDVCMLDDALLFHSVLWYSHNVLYYSS